MQARDTRKSINALRRLCKKRGITLILEPNKGRGSHQGLIFLDESTGKAITLVIANHDEISPGVQRSTLRYLGELASDRNVTIIVRNLAEIVRIILESIFN